MVTEEPVLRGQVLVQVPSSVMMTWDTARESPLCGQVVKEAQLTEWQVGPPGAVGSHLGQQRALHCRLGEAAHVMPACPPAAAVQQPSKARAHAPQALTLHLLCERAAGQQSFWSPYMQLLPAPEEVRVVMALPLLPHLPHHTRLQLDAPVIL